MVAAMQLMHNVVADEAGDSGPVCDSWATGSSGVTCTADMPSSTSSPLTIVTTTEPTATVGTSYSFGGVFAAGGTPGYSYALTQGSLPPGMTLNPTSGIISGAPTQSGTFSFTAQATDSTGTQTLSPDLSITVDPEVPVSVTTTSLPNANQDSYYSETLSASGGAVPYTWAITSGSLPAGLTVNSYGVISGTPSSWGNFSFTVQATDMSNPAQTATGNVTLDVIPIPPTTSVVVPATGASLSGTETVDATATAGVSQVQFELTGGTLTNSVVATASPTYYGWLANWNTIGVPNGTYTLQSVATYPGGVSGTSPPITVTVDNPAPTDGALVPAVSGAGSSASPCTSTPTRKPRKLRDAAHRSAGCGSETRSA
jgi:large repetitive protein